MAFPPNNTFIYLPCREHWSAAAIDKVLPPQQDARRQRTAAPPARQGGHDQGVDVADALPPGRANIVGAGRAHDHSRPADQRRNRVDREAGRQRAEHLQAADAGLGRSQQGQALGRSLAQDLSQRGRLHHQVAGVSRAVPGSEDQSRAAARQRGAGCRQGHVADGRDVRRSAAATSR